MQLHSIGAAIAAGVALPRSPFQPAPPSGGGGSQTFDEGSDGGTQWYVRPNGSTYGNSAGTSWTNAWSGFSGIVWASVSAGDTIWVAGGTYTQALNPAKSGASGNTIKIRRARSDVTACTAAAGWSAGFDATIVHQNTNIVVGDFSHIEISGSTVQSGSDPFASTRYGWRIDRSAQTAGEGIYFNNAATATGWKVRWLDLKGAGEINVSADMRGIDATPAGTSSNMRFSHLKIHDWESAIYQVGTGSGWIWEYLDVFDIAPLNTTSFHPNGLITWDAPGAIVRYSKWHKGPNGLACGEGIFFEQSGGSTGWQIYGNLFYDIDYTGVKAIEITSAVGAIKIFNNTFVNVPLAGTIYTSNSPSGSGGEQRNNYVYNCGVSTVSGITNSNNVTATNTAQFVDYAARNLHLVSTANGRNAGTALTADGFIDKDMDGNTRGADGTWDCGALEYTP